MVAYVFTKDGIPIFDATGAVITLNSAGQPVDHIRNMVTITTVYGFKNNGASPPRATPQPTMPIRVTKLIYFVTSQVERTPKAPTTTPKFAHTPGRVNQKIVNYETKVGGY